MGAQCTATHSVVNIVPSERPAPSLSAVRLLANVHTQRQSQIHNKVAQESERATVQQGVVGCCAEVQHGREQSRGKVLSP